MDGIMAEDNKSMVMRSLEEAKYLCNKLA